MATTQVGTASHFRRTVLRCAAPAILLTAACLLPFLNKAFTIDDPWNLLQAEQILKTPLRPMHFEICWNGTEQCGPQYQMGPTASLMGYALVPVILAGGSERLGHFMQLVFACVALAAMASLVLRLGFSPLQATVAALLLAAMPPFLSMASTVMADTLALCTSLVGMERLAAWKAERRWPQAVAAGVGLGLAPYARPHLVLLLVVAALFLCDGIGLAAWLRQFRQSPLLWMPVVLAALLSATLFLATREHGNATVPNFLVGARFLWNNLKGYLVYLAIPLPFTIPWILLHARSARWLLLVAPLSLAAAGLLKLYYGDLPDAIGLDGWLLLAAPVTAAALAHLLWSTWKLRSHRRLFLLLWLLFPLPAVVYVQFPIKYLLPAAPAMVLLLLESSPQISTRLATAGAVLLVVAGTSYSVALLRADNRFAGLAREAARQLVAPYAAAGHKVWSAGQWGFYWYAPRAGAFISKSGGPQAQPGDLLAVGLQEDGDQVYRRFPKRSLVRTLSESCACGRIVGEDAGLYTDVTVYSLWNWGHGEINRYELWRIE